MKTKIALLMSAFFLSSIVSFGQIGKCKGKYLGNIIAYSVPSNYTDLWNQTTSENGSKWGSIDRGNGSYNFSNSDLAYNTAKNSGGSFKFHALIWGAQAPGYLKDASAATIETAIRKWFQAVEDHYAPMGGLDFIDVLNEPVNTPINREISNLKAALTRGYQSEAANAGDKNNPYGWAIWPFQLARKHFPDATLLINEFNIEMNWNNCRAEYIRMTNAIKVAPNLTDGAKNLIDGVGLQAHGIENLTASNFKKCIDEIWDKTGVPIHITEIDIVADPNEELQRSQFASLIPVAWEHPHVAGITLWGYVQGSTWRPGNGASGPGGTDSGIQYKDLSDRPAMKWLKSYFASQPSLACCPAPGPFADCSQGSLPEVEFIAPTETAFVAPATFTIDVEASDADGEITHINFYLDDEETAFHEEWVAPYGFEWTFENPGTYVVKAVAFDDADNTSEAIIKITVNLPQAPYGGTAHPIPGTIEAEEYDVGGNGFAYYDTSEGNEGGADFRLDEDVDLEDCSDNGGGYNLGWTVAGEWTEYTVEVENAGKYDIDFQLACAGDDRTISLEIDGQSITGDIAVPNTEDWQAWKTVTVEGVQLEAGEQVIRLVIGATDYVNINNITFSLASTPPVVEITSPSDNGVYTTDDIVEVAVNASSEAGIKEVAFYANDELLSTVVSEPYSFNWEGFMPGDYEITVKVTDANGVSTLKTVTISVKSAPLTLKAGWNLIGCPFDENTEIETLFSTVLEKLEVVKDFDGFWEASATNNTLVKLEWGKGYFVKVKTDCVLDW